jgi:flagellar biogenesis protein FliO
MSVHVANEIPRTLQLGVRLGLALALFLASGAAGLAQSIDNDGPSMLREARYAADSAAAQERAASAGYVIPAAYETSSAAPALSTEPAAKDGATRDAAAKSSGKLLPPKPSATQSNSDGGAASTHGASAAAGYPSATTIVGSTCVVLSLFFAAAWVLRRAAPRSMRGLPREAIELLGRTPLVRGQQMHLVRCGNRLLLLAVSATASQTLAEISDPQEVESLLMACSGQSAPHAPREEEHHAERDEYSERRPGRSERVSELLASVTGSTDRAARRAPARGTMAAIVGEGRRA